MRQRRDIFSGQPASYYGDEDEVDGELTAYEKDAEAEGAPHSFPPALTARPTNADQTCFMFAAWEDALEELRDADIEIDDPAPSLPVAQLISLTADQPSTDATADSSDVPEGPGGKRKAATKGSAVKKAKLDAQAALEHDAAKPADAFLSVLSADNLRAPTLWTAEQMDKYIVGEQKTALLAEYGA